MTFAFGPGGGFPTLDPFAQGGGTQWGSGSAPQQGGATASGVPTWLQSVETGASIFTDLYSTIWGSKNPQDQYAPPGYVPVQPPGGYPPVQATTQPSNLGPIMLIGGIGVAAIVLVLALKK